MLGFLIIYSVQVSIQEKQEREQEQKIVQSLTWNQTLPSGESPPM